MQKLALKFGCVFALLLTAAANLPAAQIDLALNLIYDNPTDDTSGGQWQVIAASDEFGIESVSFALTGVNPSVSRAAPFGEVNGGDGAGFSFFASVSGGSTTSIIAGHGAPPTLGSEVGEFYGFGTLTNGSPNFPGADPGANTVGGSPVITSLTGTSSIPWATGDVFGDAAFDAFGTIATGTFTAGSTPEFVVTPTNTLGTVFTSLGTVDSFGGTSLSSSTIIQLLPTRTNLITLADYNGDSLVSAADYSVYRSTAGESVTPGSGADGDGSGVIDTADYEKWRADFGQSAAAVLPVAATTVIPEPATLALLATGLGVPLAALRRCRGTAKSRPKTGVL